MAIRQILTQPNPLLRKKCKRIETVDDATRQLLCDLAETMYHAPGGAGLAAPQIGILQRAIVLDMGQGLMKLVNPRIARRQGKQEVVEGCLSLPGRWGTVIRPQIVVVEALDEWGNPVTIQGTEGLAKGLCHEIDHLDGILFCDRVRKWLPEE